jgi:radical SAM protein with 4Fe4S-binding SPASM domain
MRLVEWLLKRRATRERSVVAGTDARAAAIIVAGPDGNPRTELRRAQLIKAALKGAGIDNIFIDNAPEGWSPTFAAGELATQSDVLTRFASDTVLICHTTQYHLAPEHIRKVRSHAELHNATTSFDFSSGPFKSMGMFACFAITAVRAGSTPTSIPIDDDDIAAGYEIYSRITLPKTITLELNSHCNFKCHYCPFHGRDETNPRFLTHHNDHEMCLADFERIVHDIASWNDPYDPTVTTIAPFWRGEFFLSKNWREALRIIHAAGLRSYVCSNGSLLSVPLVKEIFDTGLLDHLTITVDAVNAKMNFNTRQNKKFSKITAVIDTMSELRRSEPNKMTFGLNLNLNEYNQGVSDEYIKMFVDKADYILAGVLHDTNKADNQGVYDFQYSPFGVDNGVESRPIPCAHLHNTMRIDCQGNLHLCTACGAHTPIIGNVLDSSIKETQARSANYQEIAQAFREGRGFESEFCRTCVMYKSYFSRIEERDGIRYNISPSGWVITRVSESMPAQ